MRRFLISFLLAALAVPQTVVVVKKKAASPSYLLQERFEGATLCYSGHASTCEQGWTYMQTATADYATSPAPLQGSYSLLLNDSSDQAIVTFTGQAEVYGASIVRLSAFNATDTYILVLRDSSNNDLCTVRTYSTDTVLIRSTGGTQQSTTGLSFNSSTTYYFKIYAKAGSGSNAECRGWWSTDGTSWTAGTASTNGTWTANIARIVPQSTGTVLKIYDDIRVSTSDISW